MQSSPWSSLRSIQCNSFCGVFVEIRWIVGLLSSLSMRNIWISSEFFYVWLSYLCKSLRIISLVWPTRLIFIAMGEVLSFGFDLAVSFPSDRRGSKARIVLFPSRKKYGVYIILLEFIPLHHVILLKALLCSYELNTLDAGRSRSMCGVIVVDAGRSWSTCYGHDSYIHDHAYIIS